MAVNALDVDHGEKFVPQNGGGDYLTQIRGDEK
jgi:hypothetical protein